MTLLGPFDTQMWQCYNNSSRSIWVMHAAHLKLKGLQKFVSSDNKTVGVYRAHETSYILASSYTWSIRLKSLNDDEKSNPTQQEEIRKTRLNRRKSRFSSLGNTKVVVWLCKMMPRNSSVNSFLYWYNKWFSSVASLAMVYFFYSKGCTTCFFVASAFFLYFAGKAMPRLKRKGQYRNAMLTLTLTFDTYDADADKYNAVVVGGGVSGLNAGKCLAELGIKYVILEKRSHLGGTWWDNKYPGAACDVPSHLYSFSFYPNPW